MEDYKIKFTFSYNGKYNDGFFTGWTFQGFAGYGTNGLYSSGKSFNAFGVLKEYYKIYNHYQPYSDSGKITDWKIEIHYGENNIVDTDFVKDKIIEEVKSLGAKASFDATKMSDDEKLAIFYIAQYIAMQEVGNANRSILFREYIEDNLPASMQKEANGIVGAFPNLSAEILGNQKDTLIPDDEPYIETTNGGI